jgi:hypothetical protein
MMAPKAAKYRFQVGFGETETQRTQALHGETPFDFLRSYLADKTDKKRSRSLVH